MTPPSPSDDSAPDVKRPTMFAGSTFRQAFSMGLAVWLLPTAATLLLLGLGTPKTTEVPAQRIDELAFDWLEEVATDWMDGHFPMTLLQPVSIDVDELETGDLEPMEAYRQALRRVLYDSDDAEERRAAGIRLWVLGGTDGDELAAIGIDQDSLSSLPRHLVVDRLYDELPERLHDPLDEIAEALEDEGTEAFFEDEDVIPLPEQWPSDQLLPLLRDPDALEETLPEDTFCIQLLTQSGAWVAGNVIGDRPPQEVEPGLFKIPGTTPRPRALFSEEDEDEEEGEDEGEGEEATTCWARKVVLEDGARLYLGLHVESPPQGPLPWIAVLLCLVGIVPMVLGSYRLGSHAAGFVDDLRSARSRLEGDAFPRLRRRGRNGDFDRAAQEINSILDRLDDALGSLTHVTDNIAHDLRTPLTRLQGQLDLLRRAEQPTETMILAVQEETHQLIGTFNALLRIAQVQSGTRRQGFRTFDLRRVVEDVGELYAPAFSERGMTFSCETPPHGVTRHGDSDLWMQALSNLMDNTLKYNPDGGQARLTLHGGERPTLVLRDNGPGIPEGDLEKVFERFYRSEHYQGQRGAGLGLSLVHAVCKLHRADIRLTNDPGLVVTIQLPTSKRA